MENLRLPNIKAGTPEEQVKQLSSYMYQLVENLNYSLGELEKTSPSTQMVTIYNEAGEIVTPDDAQAKASFESIKDLIIKSADIAEAYSETYSKSLKGNYVAKSDFGTYLENSSLTIEGTSKNITQWFELLQEIDTNMSDKETRDTKSYVRSGYLDVRGDGIQVFGIEIGQQTKDETGTPIYSAYARITPEGLYLYNPSTGTLKAEFSTSKVLATNLLVQANGRTIIEADATSGKFSIDVEDSEGKPILKTNSSETKIGGFTIDANGLSKTVTGGDDTDGHWTLTSRMDSDGFYNHFIDEDGLDHEVVISEGYVETNGCIMGWHLDVYGGDHSIKIDGKDIWYDGDYRYIHEGNIGSYTVGNSSKTNRIDGQSAYAIGNIMASGYENNQINYIRTAGSSTPYTLNVNARWGNSTIATHNIVSGSSDIRLKENVEDTKVDALDIVNEIKVREFDWKDGEHQRIGFIADELQEIDERLAVGGGEEVDGTPNYKSIDTLYLVGYLTKAVQELSKEVEELKKQINK